MKKLGLVVNPIAGMGGRVGLKGTDGLGILKKAISLGAEPVAPGRAVEMLRKLVPVKDKFVLITYPQEMGENEAREATLDPKVIGKIAAGGTTSEDTRRAAGEMTREEVDLMVVVGGDGTMRDVLDVVGKDVPLLGVPAGVKLHSAAFSTGPEAAAETVLKFLWEELPLQEAEVMDVDEEAYRVGRLSAKLYGYVMVPYEPSLLQGSKVASLEAEAEADQQAAIAKHVVEHMEPDTIHLLCPGTTTRAVAEALGEEKTLLGVDVVRDRKIVATDVNERQILEIIEGKKAKVIVSPIGGQGFIFGRGNQQISPEVIRKVGKANVLVIATPRKLSAIRELKVDTGDPELDKDFKGHIRVVAGYGIVRMVPVS